MKRFIAVLGTIGVVAAGNIFGFAPGFSGIETEVAQAHRSFCSHTTFYWTTYPPSGGHPINYRERYEQGYGAGPHYHEYLTQYRVDTQYTSYWVNIHRHTRTCNNWV